MGRTVCVYKCEFILVKFKRIDKLAICLCILVDVYDMRMRRDKNKWNWIIWLAVFRTSSILNKLSRALRLIMMSCAGTHRACRSTWRVYNRLSSSAFDLRSAAIERSVMVDASLVEIFTSTHPVFGFFFLVSVFVRRASRNNKPIKCDRNTPYHAA